MVCLSPRIRILRIRRDGRSAYGAVILVVMMVVISSAPGGRGLLLLLRDLSLLLSLLRGRQDGEDPLELGLSGHNGRDLRHGHAADVLTVDGDDTISGVDPISKDRRRADP